MGRLKWTKRTQRGGKKHGDVLQVVHYECNLLGVNDIDIHMLQLLSW